MTTSEVIAAYLKQISDNRGSFFKQRQNGEIKFDGEFDPAELAELIEAHLARKQ